MTGFFDDLRDGFAFVAQKAAHVRVNEDKIADYAKMVAALPAPDTLDDGNHFVSGNLDHDFGYVLLLDSVNFGSGYKPALVAEGVEMIEGSFYFTIARKLKAKFEADPITPRTAREMQDKDVEAVFGLDKGPQSRELAARFAAAIRETGEAVSKSAPGAVDSFAYFVTQMDGRAAECVARLGALRNFHDVAAYQGRDVGFYKRAQIAAADLHLMAGKHGLELFRDIDKLTIFADNAVPHVLRTDGILTYAPELAALVDSQREIPFGSAMEVEIRGAACHAAELIAKQAGMRVMDLDHRLWHRSKDPAFKASPTHKTRTIFY